MIKTVMTALLLCAAGPAMAATLVVNSGWNGDTVNNPGDASDNSPWTFTLTSDAFFRVTDAFATGDVYTITDGANGILASTSFSTDGAAVEDYFGTSWTNTSYSRLSLLLNAGSYSITVAGDCGGGCPAGLAVRLDSVAVPEPATWGLMIVGFGLVGATMRRRTTVAA